MQKIEEKYYAIPRMEGYEEIFEPLVRKILKIENNYIKSGCDYENDTFLIKTHYFGACTCCINVKIKEFHKNHKHSNDCIQTKLSNLRDDFKSQKGYHNNPILKISRINEEKKLFNRYKIEYNKEEINHICTCDYRDNWNKFLEENPHEINCKTITPNFVYKPEDIKIWWYKIFFRDSYSNEELSINKFEEIIKNCLKIIH